MDSKTFERLADVRVRTCLSLMAHHKAPEYMRDGDRLSNFKKAGRLLGVTPEEALIGMMTKHLVSLMDIVGDIAKGQPVVLEQFREKITDAVNYLLLLEGLVSERLGVQE